jgi:hypothetical protein
MPKHNGKITYTGSPRLKDALPHGAIKQIADKYAVSYPYVWSIATGRTNTYNENILTDLEKLAEIETINREKKNKVLL